MQRPPVSSKKIPAYAHSLSRGNPGTSKVTPPASFHTPRIVRRYRIAKVRDYIGHERTGNDRRSALSEIRHTPRQGFERDEDRSHPIDDDFYFHRACLLLKFVPGEA